MCPCAMCHREGAEGVSEQASGQGGLVLEPLLSVPVSACARVCVCVRCWGPCVEILECVCVGGRVSPGVIVRTCVLGVPQRRLA